MKEKKTAVITFRTTDTVRKKLEQEADIRGWSVSQLAETIVAKYTEANTPPVGINHINIVNINQGG